MDFVLQDWIILWKRTKQDVLLARNMLPVYISLMCYVLIYLQLVNNTNCDHMVRIVVVAIIKLFDLTSLPEASNLRTPIVSMSAMHDNSNL